MELEGKAITLGTLERQDCQELWRSYEPLDPPTEPFRMGLSCECADDWFDDIQQKQGTAQLYLGIFVKERAVGDIQLAEINWVNRSASLGMSIARHQDRRQGYGTEAARLILKYGFDHLGLYRVTASIVEFNMGMEHVLLRCGFTREGRQRQEIWRSGRRWDRLLYGLICSEFRMTD